MSGCQHAGATPDGYCPQNRLCQRRLKSTTGEPGRWETMDVAACWSKGDDVWRRQVAPRQRRKGYETRIITVAQAEAEARSRGVARRELDRCLTNLEVAE